MPKFKNFLTGKIVQVEESRVAEYNSSAGWARIDDAVASAEITAARKLVADYDASARKKTK